MDKLPNTPEERGAFPHGIGHDNFDDPIKILIKLERPIYDWLASYITTEEGCTSFTDSIERTIETLIRALASDGLDLDFVKNQLAPEEFTKKIEHDDITYEGGDESLNDDDIDLPF